MASTLLALSIVHDLHDAVAHYFTAWNLSPIAAALLATLIVCRVRPFTLRRKHS